MSRTGVSVRFWSLVARGGLEEVIKKEALTVDKWLD